jgi:hypothetical protein
MEFRLRSWVNDAGLLDLMREYVQSSNRLRYAEQRASVNDSEYRYLERLRDAAAEALENGVVDRGWSLPDRSPSTLPGPRRSIRV